VTALVVALLATVAVAVNSAAAPQSGSHAASAGSLAAAPTGVTGTSGVDSASISFTPSSTSTPAVRSYTVTAYPGGEQGFGATSPVSVTGLEPSGAYTFAVTAANAAGRGPGSAPSASITPLAPPTGVTPPALSALKASLVSFFAASGGGRASRGSGTNLSYSDSAGATSTITVLQVRAGFKHAGGCAIASDGAARKPCTSLVLVGTFMHVDVAGANKLHFSGRLSGHSLKGGLYQIRITPSLDGVPGNTLKIAVDIF
jgi:hypothetical protein